MSPAEGRLYGWLLRLLPRSFRERHGDEMELAFREQSGEGHGSRPALWGGALGDLAAGVFAEWSAVAWGRSSDGRPGLFDQTLQDFRYGARALRTSPGFTLLAAGALALGIGANTAIFTLVNEVVLRPLPVSEPDRLVDLHVEEPGGNSFGGFSYPEYLDYRNGNNVLEGLAGTSNIGLRVGDEERTVQVSVELATPDFFEVLGVDAASGRVFSEQESRTQAAVAVVSHGFWERREGGRSDLVGSTVRFNGIPFTIVGIMPRGFGGRFIGFPHEAWLPVTWMNRLRPGVELEARTDGTLELIGRLRPGVSVEGAEAALVAIAAELESVYPVLYRQRSVSLTATTGIDSSLQSGVTGFVSILLALSGLVLLTACLNVGSLLLARGSYRSREMAVRAALGASRLRLARQLVAETLTLFALGSAAAIVVALQVTALLRRFVESLPIPLGFNLQVDWRVLGFTIALAGTAALGTAVGPALRVSRSRPTEALRAGAGLTFSSPYVRGAFLVGQVAVSLILLVTAGLFVQAARHGQQLDTGLDSGMLSVTTIGLPAERYSPEAARDLIAAFAERLRGSALIEDVTVAQMPPIGVARSAVTLTIPGRAPEPGQDGFAVDVNAVAVNYFAATGIAQREGRSFEPADETSGRTVAVINERMAELLWPDRSPLGQVVIEGGEQIEIVGVVENTRYIIQDPSLTALMYVPIARRPSRRSVVVLRTAADPGPINQLVRAELAGLDGTLRPPSAQPLDEIIELSLLPQRVAGRFAGALGGLALLLAVSGVYGIVSYAVACRRRELGIRVALGGQPRRQVALVMRNGVLLVGLGVVLGTVGVALFTPLLRDFLVDVSPLDPLVVGAAIGTLAAASLVASYLPARQATRIDPARALRGE